MSRVASPASRPVLLRFFICFIVSLALVNPLLGLSLLPARSAEMVPQPGASVPLTLALVKSVTFSPPGGLGPRPQPFPGSVLAIPSEGCAYNASTAELLDRTTGEDWLDWVRRLSGDMPVKFTYGETYTVTTRYTPRLFDGSQNARAYDYVLSQLQGWHYPAGSIEQDQWTGSGIAGKNIVLTIPGQITPTHAVALTAHLDSLSPAATRDTLAPGAEDNASGSAALLEAARLFRHYQFDRTVKIIWFTGEEEGMLGSKSYTNDHDVAGYLGVVNLDMFGYDSDNDRCLELHVGTLPASDVVGQCYLESVSAYNLGLTADYLLSTATSASDHSPFWQKGVGAIEVLENAFADPPGLGCKGLRDVNPYYHTVNDTVEHSFPPYINGQPNTVGADIARAGLAAVAGLAGNRSACFSAPPDITIYPPGETIELSWGPMPGAAAYRLYRKVGDGPEVLMYTGQATSWSDPEWIRYLPNWYHVEAVAADGFCISEPSLGAGVIPGFRERLYFPVVKN